MIHEQERCQRLAQVPDDVVGQHAQEDMRAHAAGQAVVDRADLESDRLEGAEGAFHTGQALVGEHRRFGIERRGGQTDAQHVEAVERRLLGDRGLLAHEGQAVSGAFQ